MSPRVFVLVVSALAVVVGIVIMTIPVSVSPNVDESIECGSGWNSSTSEASLYESGEELGAAMRGDLLFDNEGVYTSQCEDNVATNRYIGIPLLAIGGIALAGAALINNPNIGSRTKTEKPAA